MAYLLPILLILIALLTGFWLGRAFQQRRHDIAELERHIKAAKAKQLPPEFHNVVEAQTSLHNGLVRQAVAHGYQKGLGRTIHQDALAYWLDETELEGIKRFATAHASITTQQQVNAANATIDAISVRFALDTPSRENLVNNTVFPAFLRMSNQGVRGTNLH